MRTHTGQPLDSIVRLNAVKDPTYVPYCLRCRGLVRMVRTKDQGGHPIPFLWNCASCPAIGDDRTLEEIMGNQLSLKLNTTGQPVGFLVSLVGEKGQRVMCQLCVKRMEQSRLQENIKGVRCEPCPVFLVNILPYRQSCFDCSRLLVSGQTPSWPELFNGA